MLGVLENLIQCYSSYPWGNQYNDLSQHLNDSRNYGNWLIYPWADKKTFFGGLIQQAAQIYTTVQSVVTPIEASLLNTVIPGSGNILNAASNLETGLIKKATGISTATPPAYSTIIPAQATTTNPGLPGQITTPGLVDTALQFAEANPIPTILIAGGVLLALYEILKD